MASKIEVLQKFDDNRLIDVVKNYIQYGYDEEIRNSALKILNERGITIEDLEFSGNLENRTLEDANEIYVDYNKFAKVTLTLYITYILLMILVSAMSVSSDILFVITSILQWGVLISFIVYLIKTYLSHNRFYQLVGKKLGSTVVGLYIALGLPFYIIMYFYFGKQMVEEMKQIK